MYKICSCWSSQPEQNRSNFVIVLKKLINMHRACISLMVYRLCLHGASIELYLCFHRAFFKQYITDISSEEKTLVLKREIMNKNKLGYLNL